MASEESAAKAETQIDFAPPQSYSLLRKLIPGSFQPALRGLRKRWSQRRMKLEEPYHSVYSYTMMSPSRQQNLVRLCEIIERERVPGSIVECGVLDGGGSALMAYTTRGSGRPIHMFDSWQGLPATTAADGTEASKWVGEDVGSQTRVFKIMRTLDIEPSRLHAHKGWFHETFPQCCRHDRVSCDAACRL